MNINDLLKLIIILGATTSSFLVLRRNSKYLGNQLLAISMILYAIYPLGISIYDIVKTDWSVQVFLRVSMMAAIVATNFLYFSMQCIVNSTVWFETKKNWMISIAFDGLYFVYIIAVDFISYTEVSNGINVRTDLLPTALMAIMMLYYLFVSIHIVTKFGIKKSQGAQKDKLIIFMIGLLLGILSIFISAISQFPMFDETTSQMLDQLFFGILALTLIVITIGFLKKDNSNLQKAIK